MRAWALPEGVRASPVALVSWCAPNRFLARLKRKAWPAYEALTAEGGAGLGPCKLLI